MTSRFQLQRRCGWSVATVLALTVTPAQLRAQGDMPPCERYGTHPVTFLGTAGAPTRHSITERPDMVPTQLVVTPMTVERAYRGVDAAVVYLLRESLPAPLDEGGRYLVYGYTNFGRAREIVTPGVVEAIENATDDLVFLETMALSQSGGTIYGTLTTGRPDDGGRSRTPLSNVTIRFVSDGATLETVTGDDGRYMATGIPEGFVRIEPLLPEFMLGSAGGTEMPAGGCIPWNLLASLNGRVRGRVLPADGRPMSLMVDLVPVDPREAALWDRRMKVETTGQGDYEFVGVRPGAYLIGVHLSQPPSFAAPYPPTFFPGTKNRNDAVPIVVGAGTVHEQVDLTLHDPMLKGLLEVRVESDTGPGDVLLCMRSISSEVAPYAGGSYQARWGPVNIGVLDGQKYQLVGHVERRDSHSESEVVEVTGTAGRQTLTIRVNAPARSHRPGATCQGPSFSR